MQEPTVSVPLTAWEVAALLRGRLNTVDMCEDRLKADALDSKLKGAAEGVNRLKSHYDKTVQKQMQRGPLGPGNAGQGFCLNHQQQRQNAVEGAPSGPTP